MGSSSHGAVESDTYVAGSDACLNACLAGFVWHVWVKLERAAVTHAYISPKNKVAIKTVERLRDPADVQATRQNIVVERCNSYTAQHTRHAYASITAIRTHGRNYQKCKHCTKLPVELNDSY